MCSCLLACVRDDRSICLKCLGQWEVVPAAPSLLLLAPGQSSLFSAGRKVCSPTSLAAKLRSTLDTGHARRQQLNCSLTWKRQQVKAKSHREIAAWVCRRGWGLERERLTELTAVTDQRTELTLLVCRWVHRAFALKAPTNQNDRAVCV